MIKKFVAMTVLAVALTLAGTGGGIAEAGNTLQIINNSSETVTAIYCTTNLNVLGHDRLGNDILRPGESFTIRSAPVTTHRYVSVRVYFSGGRYRQWENINLDNIGRVYVN